MRLAVEVVETGSKEYSSSSSLGSFKTRATVVAVLKGFVGLDFVAVVKDAA